jgi:hypothetical protein
MKLPQKLSLEMMQQRWAGILNPVIANSILDGVAVGPIQLNANIPMDIPTTLDRTVQGWFLTDNSSNSVVWRTQPFNDKLLTLQASVVTTVSLWIY